MATQCYKRRDEAVWAVVPEYGDGYRCKIVQPSVHDPQCDALYSVVVQAPDGQTKWVRLSAEAYQGVVAATNFKQRARKMMEYYYADLLQYAVAGTPNRLEYDQGFFVKNGDGAADLKPIAHLYKSQVYQLAEHLGVPEEIRRQPTTTDAYPLRRSQEKSYFMLPLETMDLCLWKEQRNNCGGPRSAVVGLDTDQVQRVYDAIQAEALSSGAVSCGARAGGDVSEV
jgi:NAD+ synthase